MKTSFFVSLIALISVVGLSACSKKADDITPAQTQAQVGFQVKIDGAAYAPDYAYALADFPGANGYYAIYGLDSKTSDVIAIALPNSAAEGTYPIGATNFGIIDFNKAQYSTINGGTGTVTITKKTATYITGTFSFTAYDSSGLVKRTLTDGTFNVNIR